jgi:outer membrane lipoprotein-sorting protein
MMTREAPMRSFVKALTIVGALALACSAPSPVDEIVASNLEARGGVERIRALQSIRQAGTVTASGGREAQIVREIKRPDRFRLEFRYQGTTSVFAHDGDTGWQVAPLQGQFEPRVMPPEADAAGAADQRDIEGVLVDWREKGHVVELVGREALPGGEAFKLEISMSDGGVRTDYVDVESRQVVRSDVTRLMQGHPVQLQNTFSDFREVDGLVFPFRIETRAADRPEVLTITVEDIELDPELDDADFRFPG